MGWEIITGQKRGKRKVIDRVFKQRSEAIDTARKIKEDFNFILPLTTRKKRKRKK